MAVGKRVPIVFKEIQMTDAPGGATDETYVPVLSDWAVVKMRNRMRNNTDLQTQMTTEYVFSEIRERADFTPTKTMLIAYGSQDLTIDTIKLITDTIPYYYTITALNNG